MVVMSLVGAPTVQYFEDKRLREQAKQSLLGMSPSENCELVNYEKGIGDTYKFPQDADQPKS